MEAPQKRLFDDLHAHGWHVMSGGGREGLDHVLAALGTDVLLRTDVQVRPSKALVTSDRELDFHTDHHRVDLIAWLCLQQTSEGGESLLADGLAAFRSLSPAHQQQLRQTMLFEHPIFEGDRSTHPVVEDGPSGPRLYCSFWFEAPPDAETAEALRAFKRAVHAHEVARFRLAPEDVLVIDNRRILHGRTAITGSKDRHLERYWLGRREHVAST
jgi:alpha-ketoglutarate-dependent taurine dioxygenase